ncbi:HAD family hydrolase [Alteromonas sp. 1_MG-2023]|uniref:HAD family hydrolase n=1 Tax=Alteromonas sp. 1_MG-2023 TaxID=3062669 RepID=UPI0026E265ED|nr:HAD family hydrolase [Alteromonas sp. 1_MG-2023]MDO6567310.1 HAD family hydrolase [Alteromonas sp. 1_MG-2023]
MGSSKNSLENTDIQLVIFDCDGVLIDSEVLCKRVIIAMLADLGIEVTSNYFDTYFLGQSYESAQKQILADFNIMLPAEFRDNYLTALLRVFADELQITPQLNTILAQLNVKNCIATSSSPERVAFALETTGLLPFFDGRITTSKEVLYGKPAPDIFLLAASKMGIKPKNCLVIEDSEAGIQGALAADMQVVKYTGASHLKDLPVEPECDRENVHLISHWDEFFSLYPSLKGEG